MKEFARFQVVGSVLLVVSACDRSTQPSDTGKVGTPASTSEPPRPSSGSPLAAPSASGTPVPVPAGANTTTSFDSDPVGAPSPSFEAVVGDWYVIQADQIRALKVDGSKWRNGVPSASLADQAKRLYGDRYAEFLDGVKAFAFFPLAVWKSDPPSGDLSITVRFYPLAGSVDQAAGIAFGVEPDGSYFGVRANALEGNILYFRVVKGKRTVIDNVRNVSTPTKTWHTLSVEFRGRRLVARLDGQEQLDKALDTAPTGKVGLWSKADSQVLFDDFKVEPIPGSAP